MGARMIWLGGVLAAGCLSVAVYLTAGASLDGATAEELAYFRIGAGAPGSTLYNTAGEIARVISNPPGSRQCDNDAPCGVEGLIGLAQTTFDPVESLQALESDALESAIVSADVAEAALNGTGPFKKAGAVSDLRAIANVGQLVLHVVVAKEAKFKDLSALNGKRIAIGLKDSDNAVTARFLLRAAGINEKKTKLVTGDTDIAEYDLLAGDVDALAIVTQSPDAEVANLMSTGNYRFLPAAIAKDNASTYVFADQIPSTPYSVAEATPTLAVPAVWVVRASLPTELADELARALWHSVAAVEKPSGIRMDVDRISVPLHPGAEAAIAELRKAGAQMTAPQPTTN